MKRRVRKLSEQLQEMLDRASAKEKRKAKKKRRVEGVLRCGCSNGKRRTKQILKALAAENIPLPYYKEKNMATLLLETKRGVTTITKLRNNLKVNYKVIATGKHTRAHLEYQFGTKQQADKFAEESNAVNAHWKYKVVKA